ncbi:Protein arginine N-methyltransferase 3-like C2H2 zinc finger domain-containing protein [Plasmodiophora brassicae]|uniref:type I protein arginine methyltransferase n=1 Tax=Plasmodiophora brassicae TaxID=37360 RepID=A0A3P3YLC4_PLABS|nr:unnamed protein product [Plasmodiophora brassicae]
MMPPTPDNCPSDDSFTSDDDIMMDNDELCKSLLFPDVSFPSADEVFSYDHQQTGFDFRGFCRERELDFYGTVKLINYIRSCTGDGCTPQAIIETLQQSVPDNGRALWDDQKYMSPVVENDALLFCFDEASDSDSELVSLESLKAENAQLRSQIAEMRTTFRRALDLEDDDKVKTVVQRQIADRDRSYFDGYSCVDIHEEMLRDRPRTVAYMSFCEKNKDLFKDKVVLDVGCGSGILSLFAARCGAKRVIGIDNADIIVKARAAVKRNGYDHVITLIQGKVEDVELDCKVDMIISEWMGYFLLFESMLSTVVVARDRFLVDKTMVYPDRATLSICGVETSSFQDRSLSFWKDLYGFDMTDIADTSRSLESLRGTGRPTIEMLSPGCVITDECLLREIRMSSVVDSDLDFTTDFEFRALRDDTLDALVVAFSVYFEAHCDVPVQLGTSCSDPYTHWRQTVFMLNEPVGVSAGDVLSGSFRATRLASTRRDYEITFDLQINGRSRLPTMYFSLS